jgi:hypothetical protein
MMSVGAQTEVARQLVDANVTFNFLRAMTSDAMSREEFLKRLVCEDSIGPRQNDHHRRDQESPGIEKCKGGLHDLISGLTEGILHRRDRNGGRFPSASAAATIGVTKELLRNN